MIPERYRQGVQNADWHTAASSDQAEANYNTRMTQALAAKSRQNGIKRVNNDTWQSAALGKGASNIAAGVTAGIDKYKENFGKVYTAVLPTIRGLKPRTADPMQNVNQRVIPVVKAFVDNRVRGK